MAASTPSANAYYSTSTTHAAISLKSAQLSAVYRMLALNADPPDSPTTNQWKILIYDKRCRSIISPLLPVSLLRSRGVTLHLLLTSDRESIPDVPAVYFIEPTRENLVIVAQDCAQKLYSNVYLNFTTKLHRSLMEEFATLVVQHAGALQTISSLHDQYLDFVCLEKQLFSLNKVDSYLAIHGAAGVTEQLMDTYMDDVAYGLFSVVATLGCVPVIRCPKGGAPEMVARKLNRFLAEHPTLSNSNSRIKSSTLLVILDRNMDLITPLQHTSTYQALIDDVLSHNANRVEFDITSNNKVAHKRFDLDADEDPFYSNHKFNPFPEAIESNGAELADVTLREKEIRSKTGNVNTLDLPHTDLATAVDSLPMLLERKKQLEVHTSILQAVMNQVAARDVPQYYELESALAMGVYKNDNAKAKAAVKNMVLDSTNKGNVQDKLRLVMVYCLSSSKSTDVTDVVNGMVESLGNNSTGEDRLVLEKGLKAIEYIKKLRSMQMIPNITTLSESVSAPSSGGVPSSDMLSSFMARATNQATGLLAKATERVGTMLGKIHKHPATRIVENLCQHTEEDEDYLYLDARTKGGEVDVKTTLRNMTMRPSVSNVICFMIGGGCYAEYQNLQMVANERRSVCYGTTELLDPCSFLDQLGKLSSF